MSMNGPNNEIQWCDYTWNPITGCKHACRFGTACCYAETYAKRLAGTKAFPNGFEPTFHPGRLADPQRVKDPARIFVGSMADVFGAWVPRDWIADTIAATRLAPWHTFQFVTKAPTIAATWDFPNNAWVGTTITGGLSNEPARLDAARSFKAPIRFLSCEPLEGFVDVDRASPDWIIIGAATGPGGFQPDEAWVRHLETWADAHGVPVFHKDNLKLRRGARRMEFPQAR